jgi:ABC-2 type transport system ATP-binding protein
MYNESVNEVAVKGLRKEYKHAFARSKPPVVAVDRVDLTLEKGEILGFLGPNGAGKTTTIKMMLGLVRQTAGTVDYIGGLRTPNGAYRVGAVLEGSRNIYYRLTVFENLIYFAVLRGMQPGAAKKRIGELLEFFDLTGKRNSAAQTLSRGMQQKLAFAVAMVHNPDILLLDEPTLGLDVTTARAIQGMLTELAHKRGKTILLTTHQMDLAQAVSDRVMIISKGRIIAEDTVENLTGILGRKTIEFETDAFESIKVAAALAGFEYAETVSKRKAKTGFEVKLGEGRDVFRLMRALEAAGVVPERFNERVPSLEEVFISVTTSCGKLDAGGGASHSEGGAQ